MYNYYPIVVTIICIGIILWNKEEFIAKFKAESSPLDWCEENWIHSDYVAETWNTLSSFLLCVVALMGPFYYSSKVIQRIEPRLWIIWAIMFLVGIGSVYFHASLSVFGQVTDEVPIVLLVFFGVIMMQPLKTFSNLEYREAIFNPQFAYSLTIISLVFCIKYPVMSHVLALLGIPITLYRAYSLYCQTKHPQVNLAYAIALTFTAIAFSFWGVERLYCEPIKAWFMHVFGFYVSFHAIWHLFVSMAFWTFIAAGFIVRTSSDEENVKVTLVLDFIPYATVV